jgi:hypothetical protein
VQLLRRGHLSQAPKRLTRRHLWPNTSSTTGTRPIADNRGGEVRVGAPVPPTRGRLRGVQLLRRGHLSQAPKRLTRRHLSPNTPSTTGTWRIADRRAWRSWSPSAIGHGPDADEVFGRCLPLSLPPPRLRLTTASDGNAARRRRCTRGCLRQRSASAARSACVRVRVGAPVPPPRGRLGDVQLLRRGHLSQAPKRLTRRHLWPNTPSITGTWRIAAAATGDPERRLRSPRRGFGI